jgi:cytochrome c553
MSCEDRRLRAWWRLPLTLTVAAPIVALCADLAQQASALSADVPHGQVLYLKHCAGCHGHRAWGDGLRVIPALAGQRQIYLIAQLAHFASGGRAGSELHGTVMHDVLQPPDVNRAQAMRDLAAWLSQSAPNSEPEHGSGKAATEGARKYAQACAGCHGMDGAGTEQGTPALANQHYSYLLGQLDGFSSGRLRHALGVETAAFGSSEQQQAVADYLSRRALTRDTREK